MTLGKQILKLVGGESNVKSVAHCATRLRLNLKDESKGDLEGVKTVEGVVGAVKRGGVYQIIIGTDVVHVSEEIKKMGPIGETEPEKEKKENLCFFL